MSWDDYFAEERAADEGATRGKKRTVTVGWTVRTQKAEAIWGAPQAFSRQDPKPRSSKSVQVCPAAVDFDRRHFVIPCPVDVTLAFQRQPNGQLQLIDADGDQSAMRQTGLREMMVLHPQNEWRHPDRPILQMIAPYVFVADEPCFVVQTPPYLHYFPNPRPGLQMGGRFPVHVWPRPLSWGFEWYDITKPLVLKRGEPWFYVSFETENPAGRVRLVEQERTEELDSYISGILDVSNYVNQTYSLFSEAQRMRPEQLLKPKGK
ncbi:hypothetical protein [Ponticaulis profundi]|uniref:Uncharacterized protein n=1 Tax=Ponticaulis profundi TaxID=2665222 RepID=A0ABW1S932_9PROT